MLDLHDVFLRHEQLVRQRFLRVVEEQKARLRPLVEEAVRRRDVSLLDSALYAAALQLGEEVARAYLDAASGTASFLGDALGTIFGVDTTHWRFTRALVDARTTLVRSLLDDQRQAVTLAIRYAEASGRSVKSTTDWVLLLLGLSAVQVTAVANYERTLRVDRGEDTLTASPRERMVLAYVGRKLAERARGVGESEANRAVNRAQLDVVAQAVDQRLLDAVQIERMWVDRGDDKVRASHRFLNGKTVSGYTTPFLSGLGNYLLYPGDPSAPIEDWAGCRCGIKVGVRS